MPGNISLMTFILYLNSNIYIMFLSSKPNTTLNLIKLDMQHISNK